MALDNGEIRQEKRPEQAKEPRVWIQTAFGMQAATSWSVLRIPYAILAFGGGLVIKSSDAATLPFLRNGCNW